MPGREARSGEEDKARKGTAIYWVSPWASRPFLLQRPFPSRTHAHAHARTSTPSLCQLKHTPSPGGIHPPASQWVARASSTSLLDHCCGFLLWDLSASAFESTHVQLGLLLSLQTRGIAYLPEAREPRNPLHPEPPSASSLRIEIPPVLLEPAQHSPPHAFHRDQTSVILTFYKLLKRWVDEPTHLQSIMAPMFPAELK